MTFDELVTRWLEVAQTQLKERTAADYRKLYDRHINADLGHLQLRAITPRADSGEKDQ